MLFRRKRRAGAYAEQRYRRGLRSWRTKNRRTFALYFGPPIVVAFAVGITTRHVVAFSAGLIAGAFYAMWIIFREMAPRYVEVWRDGGEGERMTEKALKPLKEPDWHVFHEIQNGHGNYDHIVVGGGGVYLLDSKNLQGVLTIKRGTPHLARRHDPDGDVVFYKMRTQALANAKRLKEDIERRTGLHPWVQTVLVFWSEFPEGLVQEGKCIFIEGSRICEWLQRRPNRLGQINAEVIAEAVGDIAKEADGAVSSSELIPA